MFKFGIQGALVTLEKPPTPGTVTKPAGQVCGYLGPCVGWGLRKDQVLAAAPSLPQAVAPLAVTIAEAGLALKALGLFPTRGAVGVVRVLEKKKTPTEWKG